MRGIGERLTTVPAAALALAVLGYVGFGAGGGAGGPGLLVTLALVFVALLRVRREPAQAVVVQRVTSRAVTLLPGAALVYLAYHAGGFFPGPPALVAVTLALILAARLVAGVGSLGRLTASLAAAFTAYAAWVLASGSWSHAPDRALTEGDLALVYGLGFVLFATSVTSATDLRWVVRGVAVGSVAVCLGGFLSRTLPTFWPIAANLNTSRLSYPVTYWNALGLIAAIGIVLCFGMSADDRESRAAKALAALPVPLLAATLLLTFSRGAIAAGVVGLAACVLLSRARSLLSATITLVPTTAYAVVVAYGALSLARPLDGSSQQLAEGHHLAVVVLGCGLAAAVARVLLAGLDGALMRLSERHPVPPSKARLAGAGSLAILMLGALVLGVPGKVATQYDRFVQGDRGFHIALVRDRLTNPAANERITLWRLGVHEFDGTPITGTGAGTYALAFAARRPAKDTLVLDAHSIYAENLGELGIVGLGLLLVILLGSLVAVSRRVRRPDRMPYAVVFAVVLAWAVHAGIDWDWEMPAVSLPVFTLAGAALWRPQPAAPTRRTAYALLVLLAAVLPALISVSQSHLDTSLAAFGTHDCATATSEARDSLRPLDFRPVAHEVLAYCQVAAGQSGPAIAAMNAAVKDDPKNWEPRYGLAIVLAAARRDPRAAAQAALALNPHEQVIAAAAGVFAFDSPARWAADVAGLPLPVAGRYGPVLANLRLGGQQP